MTFLSGVTADKARLFPYSIKSSQATDGGATGLDINKLDNPVTGGPSPFHSEGIPGREYALFVLLCPGMNNAIAGERAYLLPVCGISTDRRSPTSDSKTLCTCQQ